MKDNESLHLLLEQVHELGDLELGRGPRHPTSPNQRLSTEVTNFLDTYSFLVQDRSYVDFLECYSGLLLYQDSNSGSLSVYGFDDSVTLHIVKGEGPLIDEAGVLTFADLVIPIQKEDRGEEDLLSFGFGFDTTQKRAWGVYRITDTQPWHWYCSTFLEWLQRLGRQKIFLLEDTE